LADYNPGQTVTLTGAGWAPGESVHITAVEDNSTVAWTHTSDPDPVADGTGTFTYRFAIASYFVANYSVTATGVTSGTARTTFTDANASAALDQCANDPLPSPSTDGCDTAANQWVNGNVNEAKSAFFEGDSIPYRLLFDNLNTGSHTVTIEWDTTKSSAHAIDYLTSFDRTVSTANPCLGVAGCGASTTFPIPADPQVTGAGVTPAAGVFRLYGGTITAVSGYSYPNGAGFIGDKSARITITFSPTVTNPVLAWAGHIATRADWGMTNSAVTISGSPYHTSLIELDGSGGKQDRSLSASAVTFPGSITVTKQATPESAQSFSFTASPTPLANFSLVDDGTTANTTTFADITTFTTYTVNETPLPTGWSFTSATCTVTAPNGGSQTVSGTTATINLKEGENVACTYTNTRQTGHLKLVKDVTNDNGGAAVASDFTLSADGPSPISGKGVADSTVYTGTYTLSESGPSGYGASPWSCQTNGGTAVEGASVVVGNGDSVVCTITNDDQETTLSLLKVVTNDNGGTASATDWALHVVGPTQFVVTMADEITPVTNTVLPGTYTLSESGGPDGYDPSDWTCTGATVTDGNTVIVALGTTVSCSITNDDMAPSLTLDKQLVTDNGGNASESDWTLTATGPTTLSGSGATGTTDVVSGADFAAGTYTLGESGGPAGYTASSWDCGATAVTAQGAITLGLGDSVVCTITNDDTAPKLKLIKDVHNDNGGTATAAQWTMSVSGIDPDSVVVFSGLGTATSDGTFDAGTYALHESGPTGYLPSTRWRCNNVDLSSNQITVGVGDDVTCTITNDDVAPVLVLDKEVVNDSGGNATAAEWTLSATREGDEPTVVSGPGVDDVSTDVSSDGAQLANGPLTLGTYVLAEADGPGGYEPSAWSCEGGTVGTNANGEATVTLATLGQLVTCHIVNDDIAPKLTLIKHLTNDNGGSATYEDFPLTATGSRPGNVVTGTETVHSDGTLKPDTFVLSEPTLAGYTASGWTCNDVALTTPEITLDIGDSATCEITNDDNAPSLKLVKEVRNNNGGTAVANDWTLSATGGDTELNGAGGATNANFVAGTYTLSEAPTNDPIPGYGASAWSCDAPGALTDDQLTIGLGDDITCTIINDDIAPKLHLRKVMGTLDNGGTAVATDFTLSADGADDNDFSSSGGSADSPGTLVADTFTLSESGPDGYSGSWSCEGGSQAGTSITVGIGEEATCTVTNTDNSTTLQLVKSVTNDHGGSATAADWTLSATMGGTVVSGEGGTGGAQEVVFGTYTLSEALSDPVNGPDGYLPGDWSCVGATGTTTDTVTIELGQHVVCSIDNDDIAPVLRLHKSVTNDNGGTAEASQFTLTADGSASNDLSGTVSVDSPDTLKADTFTLSETQIAGYATEGWSCDGGDLNGDQLTLGVGQEAMCTVVNDDIAPKLHLRKIVTNDDGGTATESAFTLLATGATAANSLTGTTPVDSGAALKADTWTLSETSTYGYTASDWSCVGGTQSGATIALGIGEEATCTITNDDDPGTIVIQKITKPVGVGTFAFTTTGSGLADFTLGGGDQVTTTVSAGSYTVTESTQLGWILTGIGGSADPTTPYNCTVTGSGGSSGVGDLSTRTATITVKNGDTVTCVFENTGQGVTRTQGFWQTHPQLAELAWLGGTGFGHTFPGVANTTGIGDMLICGRPVDTTAKVMGGFWSSIARKSSGAKRTALDQARMQLVQQLLAAELNASAFGTAPAGGTALFAQWETALCGTNTQAIKNAQAQAAAFNTMGDSEGFTPGTSADAKTARAMAYLEFWNIIKP
jgi:hypothetical protein